MSTDQPTLDESRNRRAHTAAFAAVADAEPTPAGIVTYRSRGKVLVIGGEAAQWLAARIEPPLHAEVLLIDGEAEPGVPLTPLAQRQLQLTGHLGAFTAELGDRGHYNHQRLDADIVVDLSDTPLIGADLPPPGYWHFTSEPADLDAALLAIDGMVGTFEKPRYFAYDADICAHSRAGRSGCRRCIDACPAEAIVSIGERIEVNPNLCQGGGTCATVCPSGAIRYAYPGPGETADRLRRLLLAYRDAGGNRPVIVFTAAEDAEGLPSLPPNLLPLAVEELASVGHELWLTALAWGAQQVVLVDGPGMPPRSRNALGEQLGVVHALLSGMGYPPEAIGLLPPAQVAAATAESRLPAAASFAATSDKRQLAGLALDHLWAGTSTHPEVVALRTVRPHPRRSRTLHLVHGLHLGMPGQGAECRRRGAAAGFLRGQLRPMRPMRRRLPRARHRTRPTLPVRTLDEATPTTTVRRPTILLRAMWQTIRHATRDRQHSRQARRPCHVPKRTCATPPADV